MSLRDVNVVYGEFPGIRLDGQDKDVLKSVIRDCVLKTPRSNSASQSCKSKHISETACIVLQ